MFSVFLLIIWLDGTDVLFNLLSIGTYGFDVGQEITKLRITLHDRISIPNNYLDGSNLRYVAVSLIMNGWLLENSQSETRIGRRHDHLGLFIFLDLAGSVSNEASNHCLRCTCFLNVILTLNDCM